MKVLNIGSMNLDYVYNVDHIVKQGETESSNSLNTFLGGKGMNQSVALAKAGVKVYQGGMIGNDGQIFINTLNEYGVNTKYIKQIEEKTGHAIIQIDKNAQNCILLFGGANQLLTEEYIDFVLNDFGTDDILLLQNEVNNMPYIVNKGYEKGMKIILNPSPFNEKLKEVDMKKISIFLLNKVEGEQITGFKNPEEIIDKMLEMFENAQIVLTLGKDGAIYADKNNRYFQSAFNVNAVDTTAAGDTFTGYFISGLVNNMHIPDVLKMSAKASAITVSRAGAAVSIPYKTEVLKAL